MAKKRSYDLHGHSFRGQIFTGYKTRASAERAAWRWAQVMELAGYEIFTVTSSYYEDGDVGETRAQAIVIYDANR